MDREQNNDSKDDASLNHNDTNQPWTRQDMAQMIQDAYSAGYAKACEDNKQALDKAAKDAVSKALGGSDVQTVQTKVEDAVVKALGGETARAEMKKILREELGESTKATSNTDKQDMVPESTSTSNNLFDILVGWFHRIAIVGNRIGPNPTVKKPDLKSPPNTGTSQAEIKKILHEESGESKKTPPNANKRDTEPESTNLSNKKPAASAKMIQAPRTSNSFSNSHPPINGCRLCYGYIINSFAQWNYERDTGLPPMPVKWGHLQSVSLQDGTIVALVRNKHIFAPEHRLLILRYKARQWEKGPLLPKSFADGLGSFELIMVCAGGKLFLISYAHMAILNLASLRNSPSLDGMEWAVHKSMLRGTYGEAAAVSEDNRYLFVVGGNHRVHTQLKNVDVFDTHTLKVTNSFPTSEGSFTSAEVIGNKLLVIGNCRLMSATIIQHNDLAPTLRADANGEVFSALDIYPKLDYDARMIARVGSCLMVASDYDDGGCVRSIEVEQNIVCNMSMWGEENMFDPHGSAKRNKERQSGLVLPDGRIVVIEGEEYEQQLVNSIYSLPLMKVCVSNLIGHLKRVQQRRGWLTPKERCSETKMTQQALLAALLPKTFGPEILESILQMILTVED